MGKMTLQEAFLLVAELAEQNVLSEDQTRGDYDLTAERHRQEKATKMMRAFILKTWGV